MQTFSLRLAGTESYRDCRVRLHVVLNICAGVALRALGWLSWHGWFRWSLVMLRFAWQAWHLGTSTVVLRGRHRNSSHRPAFCVAGLAVLALAWLWWRAWFIWFDTEWNQTKWKNMNVMKAFLVIVLFCSKKTYSSLFKKVFTQQNAIIWNKLRDDHGCRCKISSKKQHEFYSERRRPSSVSCARCCVSLRITVTFRCCRHFMPQGRKIVTENWRQIWPKIYLLSN